MLTSTEHKGETMIAMLTVLALPDTYGNATWATSSLFAVWGVSDIRRAEESVVKVAELLDSRSGNVMYVDVSETFDDGSFRTRRETRLSALAAYTLATVFADVFPGAGGESVRFFAGALSASQASVVAPTVDGYDTPFSASAPLSDVIVLRTFLYGKSGSWEFADRFKSTFGKALKAAYHEEHGTFPPVADVEVSDDYTAAICQYRTSDLPLIERTFNEWNARRAVSH
jgi:hypothetical protein